jgi:hypothetical protein
MGVNQGTWIKFEAEFEFLTQIAKCQRWLGTGLGNMCYSMVLNGFVMVWQPQAHNMNATEVLMHDKSLYSD